MAKVKQTNQFLTYLLEEGENFSNTEFKIINRQTMLGLLPCRKTLYNGRVKLYYCTEGYVSAGAAADGWQAEETLGYIRQLAEVLIKIQDNGFIRPEMVDLEPSHIFIEKNTGRIVLAALPLEQEKAAAAAKQADAVKKAFLHITEISAAAASPLLREWRRNLEACRKIPDEIPQMTDRIVKMGVPEPQTVPEKGQKLTEGRIRLISKNPSKPCSVLVDKEYFVIGKQAASVDGEVDIATVSRRHCLIVKKKEGYYLEDLGSSNHTYLNGKRLESGEQVKFLPGDTIRLAEVEFDVEPA